MLNFFYARVLTTALKILPWHLLLHAVYC